MADLSLKLFEYGKGISYHDAVGVAETIFFNYDLITIELDLS